MSASYFSPPSPPPPVLPCVSTAEAMNPSRRCTMEDVMLFVPSASASSSCSSSKHSMKKTKNARGGGEQQGRYNHGDDQQQPPKDEGDDGAAAPAPAAAAESARRDDGDNDDSVLVSSNNNIVRKESSTWNYCAIYDGHGGRDVVDFLRHALHRHVVAEIDHLAEEQAREEQLPYRDAHPLTENDVDVDAAGAPPSVTTGRSPGGTGHSQSSVDVGLALERAFLITDIHAKSLGIMSSGATVAVALIKKLRDRVDIVTANAGDARIVLCTHQPVQEVRRVNAGARTGQGATGSSGLRPVAVRLTTDHNCGNAAEVQRIEQSGGFVFRNRVVGVLAITRSLGDHALKPYVLGHPYLCHATAQLFQHQSSTSNNGAGDKENQSLVMETPCRQRGDDANAIADKKVPAAQASLSSSSDDDATHDDAAQAMDNYPHFVIVACDGLWDVMSDQEAVELVLDKVKLEGVSNRQHVAQELVDEALRRGTTDNVSAMVVFL